jgi:hypothetical protein
LLNAITAVVSQYAASTNNQPLKEAMQLISPLVSSFLNTSNSQAQLHQPTSSSSSTSLSSAALTTANHDSLDSKRPSQPIVESTSASAATSSYSSSAPSAEHEWQPAIHESKSRNARKRARATATPTPTPDEIPVSLESLSLNPMPIGNRKAHLSGVIKDIIKKRFKTASASTKELSRFIISQYRKLTSAVNDESLLRSSLFDTFKKSKQITPPIRMKDIEDALAASKHTLLSLQLDAPSSSN